MNTNGLGILQEIAGGYKGYTGIEAVKRYLSDIFTKATGNLDLNLPDGDGGRQDSWNLCMGIPIYNAQIPDVTKKANGNSTLLMAN